MKWKQYLAVMTAAAMVISGPAVPMSQVFAADAVARESSYITGRRTKSVCRGRELYTESVEW